MENSVIIKGKEVANRRCGWEHGGREELAERGRFVWR